MSFHQTGGLRLAATEREMRLFHEYKPQYAELGIPFHIRTPDEVAELHPALALSSEPDDIVVDKALRTLAGAYPS